MNVGTLLKVAAYWIDYKSFFMNAEIMRVLECFGHGPALLCATLRRFPRKMWAYKAYPHRLSIHETVWHLADREVVEYVHWRRFICGPSSGVPGIDSSAWSSSHGSYYQDIKNAVIIIRALRMVLYRSLAMLPTIAWAATAEVPIYGRISLDQWLEIRERSFAEQIGRMEDIYSEWLEVTSSAKAARLARKSRPMEMHVSTSS
ncbi:MAG: hypothetical protein WB780_18280 [Candidatus Acidiferrales bacterium]